MKTKFLLLFLAVSICLFNGCKKGDTGPQGSQGPQGIPGPAGSANVTSQEIVVSSFHWIPFGTAGQAGYGFEASFSVPEITQEIVDDGVVMVYMKFSGTSTYYGLPLTIPVNSNFSTSYLFGFSTGSLSIEMYDSDMLTLPPSIDIYLKVVTIPKSLRMKNPGVNLNNYEEVKSAFGIDSEPSIEIE